MSQEKGRARYHQEPLFRPEGPEFEPIPLEKRKAFQFRRGPTGTPPIRLLASINR
jgi:hypothetical protein